MIEKLLLRIRYSPDELEFASKINEIIDHLPQEKEVSHNYLAQEKEALFNPQPTKEVPEKLEDILEKFMDNAIEIDGRTDDVDITEAEKGRLLYQVAQEISALYRKEK